MRKAFFFICILISACDQPEEHAGLSNKPASDTPAPSLHQEPGDFTTGDNIPLSEPLIIVDNNATPGQSLEEAAQAFLSASEDEQDNIALTMEPVAENILLITRLLPEHISADVKLSLLSVLEDSEFGEVLPALQLALLDPSPEVVIAAISMLEDFERPEAISLLQPLADSAVDEDVRNAALEAIETLKEQVQL